MVVLRELAKVVLIWIKSSLYSRIIGRCCRCTTKVAHNGHGHFLVKKSVESQSLVEWRTDVHCSVHVVRLTVDDRSLSSCHHEPSSELDPQKPAVNGPSLVQGGDLRSHG